MIKYIVKRDGREEDFTPSKINKWGEWASEHLEDRVDWSSVVTHTVSVLPERCTSQELQLQLIETCLDYKTWSYYLMAGRLYAAYLFKHIHGDVIPTVKEVHATLVEKGIMRPLNYSDEEYEYVESLIDHSKNYNLPHFALHHVRGKYALLNRITGEEFETTQFVYMRMAMALAEDYSGEERRVHIAKWYEHLSANRINAPSPNYVNLGTPLNGYASCCVYTTHDTAESLAVGDHIAYIMTVMSSGIGNNINTRSLHDPVRGGLISHQGRLPYYRALVGAVKANLQNGRGGAATTHYSAFDPEVEVIARLKNQRSTESKKIRGIDYSMMVNKFLARKVARREQMFVFNSFTAPDLWDAFYASDDGKKFEELYLKYEADPNFKKEYKSARDVVLIALNEAYETGRHYMAWMDVINYHTPFLEAIYSSNLCQEIALPTKGYDNIMDLYSTEDHGRGEVGMCNLGGIVVSNIESDEQYEEVMYYTLLMIDKCIHLAEYKLPHIGVTSKARMSAGVGIMGLAHEMARRGLSYSSAAGKRFIHELAEKHYYFALKASLRLGKELGNAPWMHKTKWPQGWLPIDTYNRNVDEVVDSSLQYDWESLRQEIIANGGIRNSVLVAYMPGESSSKASATSNAIYPVRELELTKTDNNLAIRWAAPDGDVLGDAYELAWDVPTKDMVEMYAIFQKFTDQAISADFYRSIQKGDMVTSTEMIQDFLLMTRMGLKTRYYQNSDTSEGTNLQGEENTEVANTTQGVTFESIQARQAEEDDSGDCVGGACTL